MKTATSLMLFGLLAVAFVATALPSAPSAEEEDQIWEEIENDPAFADELESHNLLHVEVGPAPEDEDRFFFFSACPLKCRFPCASAGNLANVTCTISLFFGLVPIRTITCDACASTGLFGK